jgi:hypothetical protein
MTKPPPPDEIDGRKFQRLPTNWTAINHTLVARLTLAEKMNMPVTLEPAVAGHIARMVAEMANKLDQLMAMAMAMGEEKP